MELEQLVTRSFSPELDIQRILALYTQVEAVDHNGMGLSEEELRRQLETIDGDPHNARWVIEPPEAGSALVAAARVVVSPDDQAADANIVVHPDWRRKGIGSQLLERVIHHTRGHKSEVIHIYANAKHPAAPGFLQKHGFTPQGAYTELRLTEGVRLPPVTWPFGYTLRPYADVQNLATLTEAMNLSYIPLWGHQEVSEAQMASWLPNFNQAGLFLVFSEKGRVVGISRVEPSEERSVKNGAPTGYIDAPGVVPQHRRLDLYRALVLTGIRWLHDQGQSIVEMESWGDKLEVLKMYRELGFKDVRQLVSYQLILP